MGITSWSGQKLIYECSNKKVDFAKAKLSSGLYLLHAKTGVENFYFKVTYLR